MTTLRIEVSNDAILEKVMEVLRQFSKDEVEVIEESDAFRKIKKQLQKELEEATKPGAKHYTEKELREYIRENSLKK